MNILHITPEVNFAKNFVLPVIVKQQLKGHSCHLITSLSDYLDMGRVDAFRKSLPSSCSLTLIDLKLRKSILLAIKGLFSLMKLIRTNSFDVIVFHSSVDSFFPLLLSRLYAPGKRVYFNHGVPFLGYKGTLRIVLKLIEYINLRNAQLTLTVGSGMRSVLRDLSPSSIINMAPPGSACGIKLMFKSYSKLTEAKSLARRKKGFSKSDRIVLFVGRPVRRKGIYDLLKAWQKLKLNENYKLVIVGPTESELDCNIDFSQLNIFITGYVLDVSEYYMLADVLCVPSYHEGLGYAYLEAASFGCVPVCSNVPGSTDFVFDEVNGLLVEAGNINNIVSQLAKLLTDTRYRKKLSKKAFLSTRNFERDRIASAVSDLII